MSSLRDRLSRLKGLASSAAAADGTAAEETALSASSAPQAPEPGKESPAAAAPAAVSESEEDADSGTATVMDDKRRSASGSNAEEKTNKKEDWKADGAAGAEASSALHPAFKKLGIFEESNALGSFLLRRIEYPLEYQHGIHPLGALLDYASYLEPVASRQNQARLGPSPSSWRTGGKKRRTATSTKAAASLSTDSDPNAAPSLIDASRLLFLDTETTGLGVGVGNVPFMIGFGYYEAERERMVVEQTLIRHPGEERAMLQYLLGKMNGRTHLVTYNGRTFDWPVLVSRFILNGWRSNGMEPFHLDFLHPSRALWRNTLESCRLSRIEGERLGIERQEDVPGSLAPELYMRYLSDGDASHLEGVYLHNERDILTLFTLATHFGTLLSTGGEEEPSVPEGAEELFRTAAWLELHGLQERSERLYAELVSRMDEPAERWLLPTADRYKKRGCYEQAVELWERAASKAENAVLPSIDAHVELAMHYEHRSRNYRLALDYAERALELTHRLPSFGRENPKRREEREALLHRLDRLRRKSRRI